MTRDAIEGRSSAWSHALGHILVPLDGSPASERAIAHAVTLARSSGASLEVALVHVPFPSTVGEEPPRAHTRWREAAYLEHVVAAIREMLPRATVHGMHLEEPVIPALRARARDTHADLIVMTTHGRTGLSRAWLGSVADALIRDTRTPVLLLRPEEDAPPLGHVARPLQRVLIALDGSPGAEAGIDAARLVAQDPAARLVLLQVVAPVAGPAGFDADPYPLPEFPQDAALTEQAVEGARHYLLAARDRAASRTSRHVEVADVAVDAHVAAAILRAADWHAADAIAMTTHGRGATRLFRGSVIDKVLRGTIRPIVVVRPPEAAVG